MKNKKKRIDITMDKDIWTSETVIFIVNNTSKPCSMLNRCAQTRGFNGTRLFHLFSFIRVHFYICVFYHVHVRTFKLLVVVIIVLYAISITCIG